MPFSFTQVRISLLELPRLSFPPVRTKRMVPSFTRDLKRSRLMTVSFPIKPVREATFRSLFRVMDSLVVAEQTTSWMDPLSATLFIYSIRSV